MRDSSVIPLTVVRVRRRFKSEMLRNALPGMQKSRIMPGLSTPLHRYHARASAAASAPRRLLQSGPANP